MKFSERIASYGNGLKSLFIQSKIQPQVEVKSIQRAVNIDNEPYDYNTSFSNPGTLNYYQLDRLSYGLVGMLINKKAERFASCEPIVLKESNQTDATELDNHPLADIFNYPNPNETYYDLKYNALRACEKYGDAYWYVVRNNFGEPLEFWTLPTQCMQIVVQNGIITGYKYKSKNREISYSLDEVIHFCYPSDKKAPYGMGTIESNVRLIEIELAIKLMTQKFFENDAQQKVIFKAKRSLSPADFNRFKERIYQQYVGGKNSNRPYVTDNDIDVDILSNSPKEADLPETTKNNRNELLAAFGVNPAIAGFIEDVNRANAIEAKSIFLDSTISPLVQRFDSVLTRFARKEWNDLTLKVMHKIESPSDRTQQLEEMQVGLQFGAISINEFREWLGNYDPVENGDVVGNKIV